jgi:hypothetical protein
VLPVEVDRDETAIPSDKMVDQVGPRAESVNERLVPSLESGYPINVASCRAVGLDVGMDHCIPKIEPIL